MLETLIKLKYLKPVATKALPKHCQSTAKALPKHCQSTAKALQRSYFVAYEASEAEHRIRISKR
jgi:hypothetical protein